MIKKVQFTFLMEVKEELDQETIQRINLKLEEHMIKKYMYSFLDKENISNYYVNLFHFKYKNTICNIFWEVAYEIIKFLCIHIIK